MRAIFPIAALAAIVLAGSAGPLENKAAVRRLTGEAWIRGHPAALAGCFASRLTSHDPREPQPRTLPVESYIATARRWCATGGNCSLSRILCETAEGDLVTAYWVLNQLERRLLPRLAAAALGHDPLERLMVSILRFANGRIVETWNNREDLGIHADLGLVNLAILLFWSLGGAAGRGLAWLPLDRTRRQL